jgi:hypothetical protein
LATGETIEAGGGATRTLPTIARRDWSRASLEVDGRLRAYFPDSAIVAAWQIYSYALGRFSGVSGGAVVRNLDEFSYWINDRLRAKGDARRVENDYSVDPEAVRRLFPEDVLRGVTDVAVALAALATPHEGETSSVFAGATFDYKETYTLQNLAYTFSPPSPGIHRSIDLSGQEGLEPSLLRLEQALTNDVLAAHPIGFSTTSRDLLRDLIP